MNSEEMKRLAAMDALSFVRDGMILGVGTGSTVEIFIDELARRRNEFSRIKCAASSVRTKNLLEKNGFEVIDLDDRTEIYIDGADAVDRNLTLIKGGGGALTREKIVAFNSKKVIIIVDETKMKENIFDVKVPVEILPFSWKATRKRIEELGCKTELRSLNGNIFITDNGNYILDVNLKSLPDPFLINGKIKNIPGVVETGVFENMADLIIIGKNDGSVERISKTV